MTKKKWRDGTLPHLIKYVPNAMRKPAKFLPHVDHEKIVYDHGTAKGLYIFLGGG